MALQEKYYHRAFVVSLMLKIIAAITQIMLGIVLLFTTGVTDVIVFLAQHELLEDPTDFFATRINHLLPLTTHTQFVAALYLLVHGLVKGFLIWGLLKNKLWAYPASIIFIGLIIFYQIMSLASAHPIILIALTLFDILVAFLIWHEYKILMRRNIMVNNETR